MSNPPVLTTYYNGDCPVCRREIEHYRDMAERAGIHSLAFCDVAREPEPLVALGVDAEAARRRLHVVDERGAIHRGTDAFSLLWERLPRYRWLAKVARLPVIGPAADWGYEHIVSAVLYRWARRRAAKSR